MSAAATSEFNAPAFQAITPGKCHQVAFTTLSASQSFKFEVRPSDSANDLTVPQTTIIRLFSTQDCWILIGSNPTAVKGGIAAKTDTFILRGGFADFLGVKPGDRLSVIGDSASGTLDIVEGK